MKAPIRNLPHLDGVRRAFISYVVKLAEENDEESLSALGLNSSHIAALNQLPLSQLNVLARTKSWLILGVESDELSFEIQNVGRLDNGVAQIARYISYGASESMILALTPANKADYKRAKARCGIIHGATKRRRGRPCSPSERALIAAHEANLAVQGPMDGYVDLHIESGIPLDELWDSAKVIEKRRGKCGYTSNEKPGLNS